MGVIGPIEDWVIFPSVSQASHCIMMLTVASLSPTMLYRETGRCFVRGLAMINDRPTGIVLYSLLLVSYALILGTMQEYEFVRDITHWTPSYFCATKEICVVTLGYRLSVAWVLMHLVLALGAFWLRVAGSNKDVDATCWDAKIVGLLIGIVLSLVLPESFVDRLGYLHVVGGALSLLHQALVLSEAVFGYLSHSGGVVDMFHLQRRYETYAGESLSFTGLSYIVALQCALVCMVMSVYALALQEEMPGCQFHLAYSMVYAVVCLLLCVASGVYCSHREPAMRPSLLAFSIVALFCFYMFWSSTVAYGSLHCAKEYTSNGAAHVLTCVIGIVIVVFTSIYYGLWTRDQSAGVFGFNATVFHLSSAANVAYVTCLLNNWTVVTIDLQDGEWVRSVDWSETSVAYMLSKIVLAVLVIVFFARSLTHHRYLDAMKVDHLLVKSKATGSVLSQEAEEFSINDNPV